MKRIHKKAVLGLSMEFLVTIIISLVVLGGGIALLYKFVYGAEEIKQELDQRTSQELERLLIDEGKKVALPLHVAEVERGQSHVFGIGILNIAQEEQEFNIKISLAQALDELNNDITPQIKDVDSWILYDDTTFKLKEGEHRKESILINVPTDALKGQYIFNAEVFAGNKLYGNKQKFYVNVK